MRDPFKIDSPTCISFSGGRTSAYMLWRVLQSNGGLPDEAVVCFANTGKEEEATLRFVYQCSSQWNVKINWLEYKPDGLKFNVVDFGSCSRHGQPFAALIRARRFLPNSMARFCTSELKIRTMHRFLISLGWTDWDEFVGIRADEQRRAAKILARPSPETSKECMVIPLYEAGITVRDVDAFWNSSPFNLELKSYNGVTPAGNCDLCFLKATNKIQTLINEKPERALWWIEQEQYCKTITNTPQGGLFHIGRPSYAEMLRNAENQIDFIGHDEEGIACFCGD